MKKILLSVSIVALMTPAAYAQQPRPAERQTTSSDAPMSEPATYFVFFDFDESSLSPEAKDVVAEAANAYSTQGQARIVATGHTDTVGSAQYNKALSERRAQSVENELVSLGVPASSIDTVAEGETDPLIPTGDGVREPQNRRVKISVPRPQQPVAAAPAPVAQKEVVTSAPPPPAAPKLWSAGLGGFYGYSIEEDDDDNSAHLAGIQGSLEYALADHVGLGADLAGWNTLDTSSNDGFGYRAALKMPFYFAADGVRPYIGPHAGYIGGRGVQDSVIAGPTAGLQFDVADNLFLYAQVAYDVLVYRNDIDDGVINSGLGLGFRF